MALTTGDYEVAFLRQMLGVAALANDTINDLRYKFYKGVYEGTIVIGGGGGGGGMSDPIPPVGAYIGGHATEGNGASPDAYATGTQYPLKIVVAAAMTVDAIGFNIDTNEAVNAKALLYKGSSSTGLPSGLPVVDSGPLSCNVAGNVMGVVTPVALTPGIYWGFIRSNGGTTVRFRSFAQWTQQNIASTFNLLTAPQVLFNADPGTYAAPANISTYTYGNNVAGNVHPCVILRRSA